MSVTRNHHYISQFYLKGFTKSDGAKQNLYVYDKTLNKCFKSNSRNIASQRDFNRISNTENPNIIEDELAKIEGQLSISFREIIESKSYPDEKQFNHIIYFITLVSLRNPKTRSLFDDFYKKIADNFIEMTMSSEEIYLDQCRQAAIKEGYIIPYEKQKAFTEDKNRYNLEINQEVHIQSELNTLDCLNYILLQRNWYLIVSNESIGEFITSDYPVSLISSVKSNPYGIGFGTENTEVIFPISKYLAFIGVFEKHQNKILIATKENVNSINNITFEFANKQVYSMKERNLEKLKN
ncbi:DUF4238 domain-containing protein [Arcobacter vandammei]|uniref:DUF4238 domain-containing protein n=1 Tax=Arcobacter vandammei TaxID=2782243 RepID=UPI0018DF7AC5|nr:DUF4238 domain-containing protein [Arcobacter vandammei]